MVVMKFSFKSCFVLVWLLAMCAGVSGQEVLWRVDLNYRFDNREYKDLTVAESGTTFGARISPQLGIAWDKYNSLFMGVDMMSDFGQKTFYTTPDFFAYYDFDNGRLDLSAGVIPRRKITGEYSYAFFSDSLRFYDANMEGLLIHYKLGKFNFEIGCDWNSMYSSDKREKFMVFSAARYKPGAFYVGYSYDMYHHAGSYTLGGVVDNVLFSPYFGFDLSKCTGFTKFTLQAAWIQAFQNDRKYVGEYVHPGGLQFDLAMEFKRFGLSDYLYLGDNLYPYYDSPYEDDEGTHYAYHLYLGDPYYRTTSGVYNRLEAYWEPYISKGISTRISTVHHYDGHKWGWQQVVTLRLNLGGTLYSKKK